MTMTMTMTSTPLLIAKVKNLLSLLEGQIQDSQAVIDVYDLIGKVEKEMKNNIFESELRVMEYDKLIEYLKEMGEQNDKYRKAINELFSAKLSHWKESSFIPHNK